ncbi:DUF262 domain-containing protein [Actinomadura logoneensis]|uniref:DUF262 domain-containing protein n=1 Tax=Actinomadura logoneensis TaxID=2293572 RepID=A0A372JN45_9ACTN|nr:DUF262 domain-containing protein [Actinomadura logoneensis]RFU41437.1 DUF262 domain-containing protein [Actinomadura logoneensis]
MSAAGLDTQPSATTYELEDLVGEAWSGRVRVPHFQRDFRWGTQDVIRLFDSIIKGYPIGSLLLWVRQSGRDRITLGSLSIDAPGGDNILWVVDGQQRITSLANALHPKGNEHSPFSIYYDLANREFIDCPKFPDASQVPLPVLFDLDELLNWFSGPGQSSSEYFPEARRVAKLLRQYKVPAYLVRQHDERILTDIFDRMNNYGKRLSRAEIFSALFAGPEEGAPDRLSIPRIAERVAARTGFGIIDDNTVLHTILARRGPDPMRDIRSEFDDSSRRTAPEFPGEKQDAAYEEGEQALVRAVTFLQNSAGVPHLSLLTYKALLVVLTRFFAHFPNPNERNLLLLRRFYWRVAVSGPTVFKGSFTQMSRVLCALVKPGDEEGSITGLINSMNEANPATPNSERFRTNEAVGKIILCSWWALNPRSPVTGQIYDTRELTTLLSEQSTAALAVHRFYRHGLTGRQQLWAANRLFVPSETDSADTFLEGIAQQPLDMEDDVWERVLISYCLDRTSVKLFSQGHKEPFLLRRQEAVTANLATFLARMAEWNYEDTPPLDSLDLDELDESSNGVD